MATNYGLLGIKPEDRQQAAWQGLMNLGGALMAGGAPTTDISQRGRGWAAAGPAFTQAYEGNIDKAYNRNLQGLQMRQTQAGLTASANKAAAIKALGAGNVAEAFRLDPLTAQAWIKSQQMTIGEGDTVVQLPIPGATPPPAASNTQPLGGASGASTVMPSSQQPATSTSGPYDPNRPTSVFNLPDAARAPSPSIARPIPGSPPPLSGRMSMSQGQAPLTPPPLPQRMSMSPTPQVTATQAPAALSGLPPNIPPGATVVAQGRPKPPAPGMVWDAAQGTHVAHPGWLQAQIKMRKAVPEATSRLAEKTAIAKDNVAAFAVKSKAADAGRTQIQNIEAARSISDLENGNVLPSVLQYKIGQAAISLGFDPETKMMKEMVGNVSDAQQFNGVMTSLVLAKMQAQSGPQTESDTNMIRETVASLKQTPEARDFLMRISAALGYEAIIEEQFWLNHRKTKGTYDGVRQAWHKYRERVPFMGARSVTRADGTEDKRPVFFYDFHRENKHKFSDEQILAEWSGRHGRGGQR